MRPIHLLGWLLLALPLASFAGNDPYLLALGSSLPGKAPAGYTPVRVDEDAAFLAATSAGVLWIPLPD